MPAAVAVAVATLPAASTPAPLSVVVPPPKVREPPKVFTAVNDSEPEPK